MDFHVSLTGRTDLIGEIYRQLRRAILDGRLRPGDPLPPSRHLARRLGVARMTVTTAYERLAAEGFVAARIGAGTFVADDAARRAAPDPARPAGVLRARPDWDAVALPARFFQPARFDFRTGVPDGSLFPRAAWRRLVLQALDDSAPRAGRYRDAAGDPGLRAAVARHVGVARDVHAVPDDVTITGGTQQALDLLARVLLAPGEAIAVEDPGYVPPRLLFRSLGLRVVGVPVDREGLVVAALPDDVRVVYVTPSHQYPLGVAMSLSRRRELLAWADRTGAAVIEDDYDSEFRFDGRPLEPLQTLDETGRVIYVGSFSKTLAPSLRLGFVITPPAITEAVRKARWLADWHSPDLAQAALARFIESGAYARHLRKVGRTYRERHRLIADIVARDFTGRLRIVPSGTGLHLAAVAPTLSHQAIAEVTDRAAAKGVALQPLSRMAIGDSVPAGLLLGYGGITADDIPPGLDLLRASFPE